MDLNYAFGSSCEMQRCEFSPLVTISVANLLILVLVLARPSLYGGFTATGLWLWVPSDPAQRVASAKLIRAVFKGVKQIYRRWQTQEMTEASLGRISECNSLVFGAPRLHYFVFSEHASAAVPRVYSWQRAPAPQFYGKPSRAIVAEAVASHTLASRSQ